MSPIRHNVSLPEGKRVVPDPEELVHLEPNELEHAYAYELLGPVPYAMSPVVWTSRVLAHYRERLLMQLEAAALALPIEAQTALRAQIERLRGSV